MFYGREAGQPIQETCAGARGAGYQRVPLLREYNFGKGGPLPAVHVRPRRSIRGLALAAEGENPRRPRKDTSTLRGQRRLFRIDLDHLARRPTWRLAPDSRPDTRRPTSRSPAKLPLHAPRVPPRPRLRRAARRTTPRPAARPRHSRNAEVTSAAACGGLANRVHIAGHCNRQISPCSFSILRLPARSCKPVDILRDQREVRLGCFEICQRPMSGIGLAHWR